MTFWRWDNNCVPSWIQFRTIHLLQIAEVWSQWNLSQICQQFLEWFHLKKSIYNVIRWFARMMGQTTYRPSVWCSKNFFFIKSCKIIFKNPINLSLYFCKSPTFGKSYRTRNILTRFYCKSPTFGKSYRTRNIFTKFGCISPTFGPSYSTRNTLTRLIHHTEKPYFWPQLQH